MTNELAADIIDVFEDDAEVKYKVGEDVKVCGLPGNPHVVEVYVCSFLADGHNAIPRTNRHAVVGCLASACLHAIAYGRGRHNARQVNFGVIGNDVRVCFASVRIGNLICCPPLLLHKEIQRARLKRGHAHKAIQDLRVI